MVLRVFCDHCGNGVTSYKKYGYGLLGDFYPQSNQAAQYAQQKAQAYAAQQNARQQYAAAQGGGLLGVGQAVNLPAAPPARVSTIQAVDLCPRCESIWMKRVDGLSFRNHVDTSEDKPE